MTKAAIDQLMDATREALAVARGEVPAGRLHHRGFSYVPERASNRLKELREQKGLSQEQLADRVGAHYTTISKLERGAQQLNVKWMERIASALGVTVREFVEKPEDVSSRLSVIETKLDKATAKIDRLMAHLGIKED